jgi:4-diphosphocytidyl-2-C-methyl-D-erythritol kinase
MMLRMLSHAKINPFLAIGPTREDGYHEIITVLQLISLHDEISVEESDSFQFDCTEPSLSGPDNLVMQAMRLLSEQVELPPVKLTLHKMIPWQSGLGGGSSNVATALRAIQEWTKERLPGSLLLSIASALSSDAPFFLSGAPTAGCEGRGEIVYPLPAPPQTPLVVAKPDVSVSTKEAYERWDALMVKPSLPTEKESLEYRNDFELVAPEESLSLIERMRAEGAHVAHLCGSGSAVFGMFPDMDHAIQTARQLRREGYWAQPAHTLEKAPEPIWIF